MMNKHPQPEPLLRPKNMARKLTLSDEASFHTIYRWLLQSIRKGEIPYYKINNILHVRPSEVEAHLLQIRQGGGDEW